MNGLGGINKSAHGVVLGMVQLQLPVVATPDDLAAQTARIVAMVAKARRGMANTDLVVFPEYALHGLSMNTDPALMCRLDGRPRSRRFAKPASTMTSGVASRSWRPTRTAIRGTSVW